MHKIILFGEMLADVFPDKTILGGAPYNVARHLRGFLQHPILISKLGKDALKDQFLDTLSTLGMDCTGLQFDSVYPTGQVAVHIENKKHRFEIRSDQAYDYIDIISATNAALPTNSNILYFGSLAQRGRNSRNALDGILSTTTCPKFLDINLRAPWYNKNIIHHSLSQADIVKVNEDELAIITSELELNAQSHKAQAALLLESFELQTLYITCGERGAWALTNAGEVFIATPPPLGQALVDTVGAGDAFSAISILGVLNNWPTERTINRANTFAAAVCEIRGATPAAESFYLPFLTWLEA